MFWQEFSRNSLCKLSPLNLLFSPTADSRRKAFNLRVETSRFLAGYFRRTRSDSRRSNGLTMRDYMCPLACNLAQTLLEQWENPRVRASRTRENCAAYLIVAHGSGLRLFLRNLPPKNVCAQSRLTPPSTGQMDLTPCAPFVLQIVILEPPTRTRESTL